MNHLKSPLLQSIPLLRHGFGTCAEPKPGPLSHPHQEWPRWKQVHGTQSAEVLNAGQECGEVDAMYTFKPQVLITVMTADCVPILMARQDGKAIAAIHAGWRGTRARIVQAVWEKLSSSGENPRDWVAAIGPAIGPCCYEVSEELVSEFQRGFPGISPGEITPRGPRMLDLPQINRRQLEALGFSSVDVIRSCTRCARSPDGAHLHHSYRREPQAGRQWSMIERG